ncbi:spermidine resistance protein [Blyttiomyces sp. JEL0837]|nr:spermidine resistance protein [Blyttiomyces sp. JEL0837]
MVNPTSATKGPDATAIPPHPLNHNIYTTAPASEKLTLSGFEGPEKLLEIWFRQPTTPVVHRNVHLRNARRTLEDLANGNLSRASSPASITTSSGRSESDDSVDSGIDSLIDAPTHPYEKGSGGSDGHGRWKYRRTGLRVVPRPVWEEMLAIVKCQVLSVINNEHCDAYLLSESSMFVYPNRLILKTCGTTTLLNAVSRIFEIARDHCNMDDLDAIFYSRKAFLFPEKQLWPHGRWGDEVAYLDELFPAESFETSGYVVGKINGDHWCLYMATPIVTHLDEDGVEVRDPPSSIDPDYIGNGNSNGIQGHLGGGAGAAGISSPVRDEFDNDSDAENPDDEDDDVTLEIMMQDLDPNVTKIFWRTEEEMKEAAEIEAREGISGKPDLSHIISTAKPNGIDHVHKNVRKGERRVLDETGISDVYPNSIVDDYLFDPCGYSLNGLLGPYYYTIHVTPEDICSYASFETSVPVKKFYNHVRPGSESEYGNFEDVVQKVVGCFKPGRFSVTLFTRNNVARRHGRHGAGLMEHGRVEGFRRTDRIVHTLGKWELVFSHYAKSDAKYEKSHHTGVRVLKVASTAGAAGTAVPVAAAAPTVAVVGNGGSEINDNKKKEKERRKSVVVAGMTADELVEVKPVSVVTGDDAMVR